MNEDIVVPLAGMIMTVVLVLGLPLVIAHIRRAGRAAPQGVSDGHSDERLERIEHAIDAMAVEIERISEGQRFVTKLLAERERVSISGGREGSP